MADPRDYKLDIGGLKPSEPLREPAEPLREPTETSHEMVSGGRPFLRVHFACCNQYLRIYRSPDGRHYSGHCPRCAKPVRFVVGPGGTCARDFTVY